MHQILQRPAKGRFQLQVLEQQHAINAAQIRVFGASDEVPHERLDPHCW